MNYKKTHKKGKENYQNARELFRFKHPKDQNTLFEPPRNKNKTK